MLNEQTAFAALVSEIHECIPELRERTITPADSLRDLGLNSMDRVDLIMSMQSMAGVRIPMTAFAGARNIQDVLDCILREVRA